MVVAMGQRSHREQDIRAVEIWLSICCYDEDRDRYQNSRERKNARLSF
jgi:hypothetical protein